MMLSEREYAALVTATTDADVTALLMACVAATLLSWVWGLCVLGGRGGA